MAWHNARTGAFGRYSAEALDNATAIYGVLNSIGWTLEAVCGVLGNIEAESGYNPWRWEGDRVLNQGDPNISTSYTNGYGLCQWTPSGKYINNASGYSGYGPNYNNMSGSEYDGYAQMLFLDENADYFKNPNHPEYWIPYNQYKQATISDYSIDFLAHAWFYNFERGTWFDTRVYAAEYWYTTLGGITPPTPPTPPTPQGNIPIWLLFKLKEVNGLV